MKKEKSHALMAGLSFLLLLMITAPAPAQEGRKGLHRNIIATFRPPSPEEEVSISNKLELSAEQKTQMKAVSERYRKDSENILAKYREAYDDVVNLMQETDPNKTVVNDHLKAFHGVHEEILSKEVSYWMDFKGILTPEQNRKFWNLFEQDRVRPDKTTSR